MSYYCENNCCFYKKIDYEEKPIRKYIRRKNKKKAGVLVYDQNARKILLVQSKGKLWGPPKGTVEESETFLDCAKRELKEETGLEFPDNYYNIGSHVKSNAFYFFICTNIMDVNVQNAHKNDANGIGWFSVDCIKNMKFDINQHCKLTLRKFLEIDFPKKQKNLLIN